MVTNRKSFFQLRKRFITINERRKAMSTKAKHSKRSSLSSKAYKPFLMFERKAKVKNEKRRLTSKA